MAVVGESLILAASNGGKRSTDIGREGERQAGINQSEKQSVEINGRTRTPDGLNAESLTEVKNVRYISNTLQLRDYADYALKAGIIKKLIVRAGMGTRIARTVIDAGWEIIRLIVN